MSHHITHHEESRFSPKQIYDLVADVPSYPQFLPWCKGARLIERISDTEFRAELVIAFKGITERYGSHVSLTPPDDKGVCSILAKSAEGPFHHLTNLWTFTPTSTGGTNINLDLDFQFQNRILDSLIAGLFGKASEKMVSAFRQRARELYGVSSGH